MPWPSWLPFSGQTSDKEDEARRTSSSPPKKPTGFTNVVSPQTESIAAILAALALYRLWKTYLRRIPTVDHLKPTFYRKRSLYGYVSRVGDGDNFHLYHTPGGRLAGWGLLPWRNVKELKGKEFKGKTLHVRIAGVDAPEAAHFGRPSQPRSQEALDWLRGRVLNQYVRVYPYSRDQYGRVVSSVFTRTWVGTKSDVGLAMIKAGMATVYEAKTGSEFGGQEEQYRRAEEGARRSGVGMWQKGIWDKLTGKKGRAPETPREYKKRMEAEEK